MFVFKYRLSDEEEMVRLNRFSRSSAMLVCVL